MIWDHLFGTYQAELRDIPIRYGLPQPHVTQQPFCHRL